MRYQHPRPGDAKYFRASAVKITAGFSRLWFNDRTIVADALLTASRQCPSLQSLSWRRCSWSNRGRSSRHVVAANAAGPGSGSAANAARGCADAAASSIAAVSAGGTAVAAVGLLIDAGPTAACAAAALAPPVAARHCVKLEVRQRRDHWKIGHDYEFLQKRRGRAASAPIAAGPIKR
jgi:hypothetical protein